MKVAEDQKNVTTNKLQSKKEQPGTFDLVLYMNLSKMTALIKKKKKSNLSFWWYEIMNLTTICIYFV